MNFILSAIVTKPKHKYFEASGDYDLTKNYCPEVSPLKISYELNQPTVVEFGLVEITDLSKVPKVDDLVYLSGHYGVSSDLEMRQLFEGADFHETYHQNMFFYGFINQSPELVFLGSNSTTTGAWGYKITAVSLDGFLNAKGTPFDIPPYIGQPHAVILQDLASRILINAGHSTSNLAQLQIPLAPMWQGNTESFYTVDSSKKWSEIAAEFAEMDNSRYWFSNVFKMEYEKIVDEQIENTTTLVNDRDWIKLTDKNETFLNSSLTLKLQDMEYKNDVTIVGKECPDFPVNEEFSADGVTASFNLQELPYGASETDILEESWNVSSIDEGVWNVDANVTGRIEAGGEALNLTAGTTYKGLYANTAIELAGQLVFRVGEVQFTTIPANISDPDYFGAVTFVPVTSEIDFFDSSKSLACFYVDKVSPNSAYLRAKYRNDAASMGTSSGFVVVDTGKSYILRILLSVEEPLRNLSTYSAGEDIANFRKSNGKITFEVESFDINTPDQVTYTCLGKHDIFDIPAAGLFYLAYTKNTTSILNYTKLSKPVQVEAYVKKIDGTTTPVKIGSSLDGCDADLIVSGQSCALSFYGTKSDGVTSNIPPAFSTVKLRYWATGKALARVVDNAGIISKRGISNVGTAQITSAQIMYGTGAVILNSGGIAYLSINISNDFNKPENFFQGHCLQLGSSWNNSGLITTVLASSSTSLTVLCNPSTDNSSFPEVYFSKASNLVSCSFVILDFLKAFDDGKRSIIVDNLNPAPRTDLEAELAARAYLDDHTNLRWEGSYTGVLGDVVKVIPVPGATVDIDVKHLLALRDQKIFTTSTSYLVRAKLTSISLELFGSKVASGRTLLDLYPSSTSIVCGVLKYELGFRSSEKLKTLLNKFLIGPRGTIYNKDLAKVKIPTNTSVSANYYPDAPSVEVYSVDPDHVHIHVLTTKAATNPTYTHVEVRDKDSGWGIGSGLIANTELSATTVSSIELDRSNVLRKTNLYFRLTNSNKTAYSRHSTILHLDYPGAPPPPIEVTTKLDTKWNFTIKLPSGTTQAVLNDGTNYYIKDIQGVEIRDKYLNLIYKGSGEPSLDIQSPAFNTLPAVEGKKDFLFHVSGTSVTIKKSTALISETATDSLSNILVFSKDTGTLSDLTTHYNCTQIALALINGSAPVDNNGRFWQINQFSGYRLHLYVTGYGWVYGTILQSTNAGVITFVNDTDYVLTSADTVTDLYINVADSYTAGISANVITVSFPVNIPDADLRDTRHFFVATYNTLNEYGWNFKTSTNALAGASELLVSPSPIAESGYFGSKCFFKDVPPSATNTENNYWEDTYNFIEGTQLAIMPKSGSSFYSGKTFYTVAPGSTSSKITLGTALGGAIALGSSVHKLLIFRNLAPFITATNGDVPAIRKNTNNQIVWEGQYATYYVLTITGVAPVSSLIPDPNIPTWAPAINYPSGSYVIHDGTYYKRTNLNNYSSGDDLQESFRYFASLDTHPDVGAIWWEVVTTPPTIPSVAQVPYTRDIRIEHPGLEEEKLLVTCDHLTDFEKNTNVTFTFKVVAHDILGSFTRSNTDSPPVAVGNSPVVQAKVTGRTLELTVNAPKKTSAGVADTPDPAWRNYGCVIDISKGITPKATDTKPSAFYSESKFVPYTYTFNANEDGSYTYSVKGQINPSTYTTPVTGTVNLANATAGGDYANEWSGIFHDEYAISGRRNIEDNNPDPNTSDTILNPAVFLLAANTYAGVRESLEDAIYPPFYSGDFCISSNVKDAYIAEWDGTRTYAKYERVTYGLKSDNVTPKVYKSKLSTNTANVPNIVGSTYWEEDTTAVLPASFLKFSPLRSTMEYKGKLVITGDSYTEGNLIVGDKHQILGHVVLGGYGVTGWSGNPSVSDNLCFLLSTSSNTYTIGTASYPAIAGDLWIRQGYIGGAGSGEFAGETIAISRDGLSSGRYSAAKWVVGTTYGLHATVCDELGGNYYKSLTSGNVGNALPLPTVLTDTHWLPITRGFSISTGGTAYFDNLTLKVTGSPTASTGSVYAGYQGDGTDYKVWWGGFMSSIALAGRYKMTSRDISTGYIPPTSSTYGFLTTSVGHIGDTVIGVDGYGEFAVGEKFTFPGYETVYTITQQTSALKGTPSALATNSITISPAIVAQVPTLTPIQNYNPVVFLLGWGDYAGDTVHPSFEPGTFIVSDDAKLFYSYPISGIGFRKENGVGVLTVKGNISIISSSTVSSTLTIDSTGSIVAGNSSGAHTQMTSSGFYGWSGPDSSDPAQSGNPTEHLLFGFSTYDWGDVVIGTDTYHIHPGDFFAYQGHFLGVQIADKGLLVGDVAAGHTTIDSTGIWGWSGAKTNDGANLKFALFTTTGTYYGDPNVQAGDLWFRRGYVAGVTGGAAISIDPNGFQCNYVTGVSGYKINVDGTAEFQSVTVRAGGMPSANTGSVYAGYQGDGTDYKVWWGGFMSSVALAGRHKMTSKSTGYNPPTSSAYNFFTTASTSAGATVISVMGGLNKFVVGEKFTFCGYETIYTIVSQLTTPVGSPAVDTTYQITVTPALTATIPGGTHIQNYNPVVFLLGWDTFSDTTDPVHPSFEPGTFIVSDDAKLFFDHNIAGVGFRKVNGVGVLTVKGNFNVFGDSSVSGSLAITGSGNIVAGSLVSHHAQMTSSGFYGWSGPDSSDPAQSGDPTANLLYGFSTIEWGNVTIGGDVYNIQPGDFFAYQGHFLGVTIASRGLLVGTEDSNHVVMNSTGICGWGGHHDEGDNVKFALFAANSDVFISSEVKNAAAFNSWYTLGATSSTSSRIAQRFSIGSEIDSISNIAAKIQAVTGSTHPTGITAYIYSDSGGQPSVLKGTCTEILWDSLPTVSAGDSTNIVYFTPSTWLSVTANTTYWLVIECALTSAHVSGGTAIKVGVSINGTTTGLLYYSANNATWSNLASYDLIYDIGARFSSLAGDVWFRRGFIGGDANNYAMVVEATKIYSSNFKTGGAAIGKGFCLNYDGTAEFESVTIRVGGSITGTPGATGPAGPQGPKGEPGTLPAVLYAGYMGVEAGYATEWWGTFLTAEALIGRVNVGGTSTLNPVTFLLASNSCAQNSILPEFAAGDFCISENVKAAYPTELVPEPTALHYLRYRLSDGLAIKGNVNITGDSTVSGTLAAGTRTSTHVTLNFGGVLGWDGPDTGEGYGHVGDPHHLTFGFTTTDFLQVPMLDDKGATKLYNVLAGSFWAKHGYIGGVTISNGLESRTDNTARTWSIAANGDASFNSIRLKVSGVPNPGTTPGNGSDNHNVIYAGVAEGSYENDYYGVFMTSLGLFGKYNDTVNALNPCVFLLAAQANGTADSILPIFGTGDFCLADNVKTAYETPTSSSGFLKFVKSSNTLSLKGVLEVIGDSKVTSKLTVGATSTFGSAGIQLDYSTNTARFYVGNGGASYMQWDGTTLTVRGDILATNVAATMGTIGGWIIDSSSLQSAATGLARISLDKANQRISVVNSSNTPKVAMGYLGGLTKNAGGTWGTGDYGFWAASGDTLRIDGSGEYIKGDWIVKNDASYLIQDSALKTVAQFGTYNGERGLFLFNTNSTPALVAKFMTTGASIGGITVTTSSIESTGYSLGSAGFKINSNGIAEFNQVTISGDLKGALGGVLKTDVITFWAGDTYANRAIAPFMVSSGGIVSINRLPGRAFTRFWGVSTSSIISMYNSTETSTLVDLIGWQRTGEQFGTLIVRGVLGTYSGLTSTLYPGGLDINGLQVVGARQAAITSMTGRNIDGEWTAENSYTLSECQDRITSILAALRTHGLIAT